MLNYVNRVLVGKSSGATTTGTGVSNLVQGDLLLIDSQTGATLSTAALAAASTSARIVNGGRNGSPILSSPIDRSTIVKYTKQVYLAASPASETYTGLTMAAGKEYKLVVVFKDDQRLIANRQTRVVISHIFPATGSTLAAELIKLRDKVNAAKQAKGLLVASISGTDLVLTGQAIPTRGIDDYQYVNFTSTFVNVTDDTYVNANTIVAPVAGNGLPVQVRDAERKALGYLGFTDLRDFRTNKDVPFNTSDTVTGGGYDIYHIIHFDKHTGDLQHTMSSPLQTTVAIATGSAQATAFEALMEAFVEALATGAVDFE